MQNTQLIKISYLVQDKIISKPAYIGVKMTLLTQKHNIVRKIDYLCA